MANPRTPTPIRKLEGNPGHRAIPDEVEVPVAEGAQPPAWLRSKAAVDAWHDLAPTLESLGLLTVIDPMSLALLCDLYAKVQRGGKDYHKNATLLKQMLTEFGMTPASRSKVVPAEVKKPGSAWDELDRMGV